MPAYEWYMLGLKFFWLIFVVANGACVGSLINVLVYRLPRGISVIWPPSRCPSCETQLTWRENIPIVGWLMLRGKCRFCKAPVSPEYPLVEAFTAGLFGLVFVILAWMPHKLPWLGVNLGGMRPEWAWNAVELIWPMYVLVLLLVGCLVAMTLVDLKTYTIPAPLTTVPALAALLIHPIHAAVVYWNSESRVLALAVGQIWTIPVPQSWRLLLAMLGGALGLILGVGLLKAGLLRRSFADYEEWEAGARAGLIGDGSARPAPTDSKPDQLAECGDEYPSGEPALPQALNHQQQAGPFPVAIVPGVDQAGTPVTADAQPPMPEEQLRPLTTDSVARVLWCVLISMVTGLAGLVIVPMITDWPRAAGLMLGVLLGPVVSGMIFGQRPDSGGSDVASPSSQTDENPAEMWLEYPHARREMLYELLYLTPAFALAMLGWHAAGWLGLNEPGQHGPYWLHVLGGVVMGYLIGGGVVWSIRILGSLVAGREAMGLGDVHMMAAVGACLGWIDATLAFFVAAFVGLYFVLVRVVWIGSAGRAMPYGPYLAIATLLVFLGKPWVEQGLSRLTQGPVNLP
jgi:prepilin signal peptidase PulO-like enzyme (type II secretory pathway)